MIRALVISLIASVAMLLPGQSAYGMTNNQWERRITYQINQVKSNHNLHHVRFGPCIDGVAERHGRYLSSRRPVELVHQSVLPFLYECNGYWGGEVLAVGYKNPYRTVRAWMNSPEHRAIILRGQARRIGVDVRSTPRGKLVVVNFIAH